ncbi:esterase [Sinosporangium album]|uniref:Esterase n=1 Tax=Sinosporangium album TaxID=504805 RepID=A0A1G8KNU4_9ACTN|nr:alpha/beta hydrolase [Sinosporangium album]SDI45073.1 esterase [Sinosporangium album]
MERTVEVNGIHLWCETFGDPADPAILLVMGLGARASVWPDELCRLLQESGRYVIRYDNRDTGQSGRVDFDAQPYTTIDLAQDAVGLLDGLGIGTADVVGASMGGMIAQEMALQHADRLRTLTLIMSSAEPIDPETSNFRGTPRDPQLAAWDAEQISNPPTTREEHIQAQLKLARLLSGRLAPFDEAATRAIIERQIESAASAGHAAKNHILAIFASRDRSGLVGSITVPTLVMHGTDDVMAPIAHGKALAAAIPGSEFIPIEGMGHSFPPPAVPVMADAILRHTER